MLKIAAVDGLAKELFLLDDERDESCFVVRWLFVHFSGTQDATAAQRVVLLPHFLRQLAS